MSSWERSVLIANGIAVRVLGTEPGWLELLPPASEQQEVAATLRLEPSSGEGALRSGPIAFQADLRWSSAARARFQVPGGRGELRIGAAPLVEACLALNRGDEPAALGTTLRMLLGLLLPLFGGLLVHASAVVISEQAHVFLGASGAGKTTTARRLAAEGALLIAEDLLVLRSGAEAVRAESCRFDYCADARGAQSVEQLVGGAYLVYKNASRTAVCAPRTSSLQAWSSAIFSPLVSPSWTGQFMETLSAMQRIPLHGLAAAPQGRLRHALQV